MTPPGGSTVAVCIATNRRPSGLDALLRSIAGLDPAPGYRVRVVVVDNDPARSAEPMCARWAPTLVVCYLHEPRPGVSHVRNAAVAAVTDADWVAFVDDDETVPSHWLVELLRVRDQFDADVVTGPVRPVFQLPPPAWLVLSGYLAPPSRATGESLTWAATNNTLARRSVLDRFGPFDPAYALTGGEDQRLFAHAAAAGCRIVWAAGAVVSETMPAERLRLSWHLRRGVREGNLSARIAGELQPARARSATGAVMTLARCGAGAPIALLLGRKDQALRGLRTACAQVGVLGAALGLVYAQYGGEQGWMRASRAARAAR